MYQSLPPVRIEPQAALDWAVWSDIFMPVMNKGEGRQQFRRVLAPLQGKENMILTKRTWKTSI